jgi:hypothetical protein
MFDVRRAVLCVLLLPLLVATSSCIATRKLPITELSSTPTSARTYPFRVVSLVPAAFATRLFERATSALLFESSCVLSLLEFANAFLLLSTGFVSQRFRSSLNNKSAKLG